MTFIISLLIILLGYIIFLLTIGGIVLILRIGNPVTKILQDMGILNHNYYKFNLIWDVVFFSIATFVFYQYFYNFFLYLIIGYILCAFVIIKNFKTRYTLNEGSFKNWYLKDYYDKFDFSRFPDNQKKFFQDTNNLFNFIFTALKSKNKKHE